MDKLTELEKRVELLEAHMADDKKLDEMIRRLIRDLEAVTDDELR